MGFTKREGLLKPVGAEAEDEDRVWLDADASCLGEFEPYEWEPGELEAGRPVEYVEKGGFVVKGGEDGE